MPKSFAVTAWRSLWGVANRRPIVASALIAVFVLSTLVSCSQVNPDFGSTLNRGLNADPESLDPQLSSSTQSSTVLYDLREGLVTRDRNGRLAPGAAKEWIVSADGKTYTFNLRSNLKWSNGEELDSRDFVYAFRRLVDPQTASPHAHMLSQVIGAEEIIAGISNPDSLGVLAVDKDTLKIELASPVPYFLQVLSHSSLVPIYIDRSAGKVSRISGLTAITNGAYRLVGHEINSSLTLVKNLFYWGSENTKIERVIYHVIGQEAEANRYRAGEIDITDSVSEVAFQMFQEDRRNELHVSPMLGVYYYGLNVTKPPFKDHPAIRTALSLAIDRNVLVKSVIGRGEIPAYGLVPQGVTGYESPDFRYSNISQEARNEIARGILRDAGYSDSNKFTFELRYNTGGGHEKIALAIQSMWRRELGVEVSLRAEEFKVFISNVRAMSTTEAYRLSWTGDYDDPLTFLQLFETGNPSNLTGYSNRVVDKLLARGQIELDANMREKLLQDAELISIEDCPLIPIYYYVSKHLVNPRVNGWSDSILDIHLSRHLALD